MVRYWWIRASCIGCAYTSLRLGLGWLERRLALGDAVRVYPEHVPDLLVVETRRSPRRAQRDVQ